MVLGREAALLLQCWLLWNLLQMPSIRFLLQHFSWVSGHVCCASNSHVTAHDDSSSSLVHPSVLKN